MPPMLTDPKLRRLAVQWVAHVVLDRWPDLEGWSVRVNTTTELQAVVATLSARRDDVRYEWRLVVTNEMIARRAEDRIEAMVDGYAREAARRGLFDTLAVPEPEPIMVVGPRLRFTGLPAELLLLIGRLRGRLPDGGTAETLQRCDELLDAAGLEAT